MKQRKVYECLVGLRSWDVTQPVFTYCDREGVKKSMDNESSSVIASKLFQRIEYTVIKSPSEASIKKDLVVSFMANATMIAKSRIFLLI
ncbi:hypothetical protein J3Q64DRAFT_1839691 [Phycomyces blakesleeanus]|uniref:Uncharacterized protein n=1 Tax=Phycomyces blakesleeanus TaxID=4837 RepID=A0ABR3AMQ6_PHYBL